MDTSETYIKMCDCPEIQAGHEFVDYDYFVRSKEYYREDPFVYPYDECRLEKNNIWLPRQDQLQEMVDGDTAYKLGSFFRWLLLGLSQGFTSMEQLWLAFAMKEKYGKVWDGSKWIKGEL